MGSWLMIAGRKSQSKWLPLFTRTPSNRWVNRACERWPSVWCSKLTRVLEERLTALATRRCSQRWSFRVRHLTDNLWSTIMKSPAAVPPNKTLGSEDVYLDKEFMRSAVCQLMPLCPEVIVCHAEKGSRVFWCLFGVYYWWAPERLKRNRSN